MRPAALMIVLLWVAGFALVTRVEPWFQTWPGYRARSGDVLTTVLGDSRRLFARHFYVKADAYFHSGYYPTIFDTRPESGQMHIAAHAGTGQDQHHDEESPFLAKPRDWIDAFSRNFFPSEHSHLGEEAEDHHHHHHHESKGESPAESKNIERELLPWLRVAATLDPEQPETYVVASYWLRSRLGKTDEAEQFLREGLQSNPGDPEILLELGRIYHDNRNDPTRAGHVWELALRNWREKEAPKPEPNILVGAQILGALAKLEETRGHYDAAINYVLQLKAISPNKDSLQKWIEELKQKQTGPKPEQSN